MSDVKILEEMIKRFISDVERGMPIEDAGWMKKEPNVESVLKRLGLDEHGTRGIRVSLRNPLPKDLLRTEEEDLFSDMQQAAKIRELVSQIGGDLSLQTGVEICGFAYMLDESDFPVLSYRLFEKGFSSIDEWYASISNSTYLLASLAAKKVWDIENIQEVFEPLRRSSLPIFEAKKQNKEAADRIGKVLKWNEVLEIINSETCKIFGFLWYVDRLTVLKGVRYPESVALIQERAWKMLEKKTRKSMKVLRNAVFEDVDLVEMRTIDQDFAIASWHEILRLPW